MPFTELYIQANGDNRNTGTTTSPTPIYSAVAGDWDNTTGRYTPNSGDPSLLVSPGDYASLYINSSGIAQNLRRVISVDSSGYYLVTATTTGGTGSTLITQSGNIASRVGGAWLGPSGTQNMPFGNQTNAARLRNISGYRVRVNIKNDRIYNVTSSTPFWNGNGGVFPLTIQGYNTIPGDSGQAIFDGGTGASFTIADTTTAGLVDLIDLIFRNNGNTGSSIGVQLGSTNRAIRCVFANCKGAGVSLGNRSVLIDCESYNNGSTGYTGVTNMFYRCIAHHNGSHGFNNSSVAGWMNCISYANSGHGFNHAATTSFVSAINCDSYANMGHGYAMTGSTSAQTFGYLVNCNLVNNSGYAIWGDPTSTRSYSLRLANCGFGSGSMENVSGVIPSHITAILGENLFNYPAGETPWANPNIGDFRIVHKLAKGRGNGYFTQTAEGQGGTIGYPDVGAASHINTDRTVHVPVSLTTINAANPIKDAGSTINGIPRS